MAARGATRQVIDGRGMEPPQPFEHVMAALVALPRGESVLLILPREPFPLFRVLANSGFVWQCEKTAEGDFEITIRHSS